MSVFKIDDLLSRDRLDAHAEKPARLAVLGYPVAHSASPIFQQAALDANGIHARYIRLEILPGQLHQAFERMQALGFLGCNITVPHKLDAMNFCTELEPNARVLGAVNTVKFDTGRATGSNTDGPGFASAIEESFGKNLANFRVILVGAGGGAGQALAMQCALAGVKKLVLVNRSAEKLSPLADRLRAVSAVTEIIPLSLDDRSLADQCNDCDLIVNASSVGLKMDDPSILPTGCLQSHHCVFDTIYQPAVTPLLAAANALGCQTANGFSMLLHQGALAFQMWFPGTNPLPVMRESFR